MSAARPTRSRRSAAAVLAAAVALPVSLAALPAAAAGTHGGTGPAVLARNLDNPRGLGFGADGALYVAESGRGGAGPCFEGPEGRTCFGTSGAVTRLRHGQQRRVLSGLPSLAAPDGTNAIGPTDVAAGDGLLVTVGLGANPAVRTQLPALAETARLVRAFPPRTGVRTVADLGTFEAASDPDKAGPDTNPTSVLAGRVVVDAGANALLRVSAKGRVAVLAVFPSRLVAAPPGLPPGQLPMQSVPTSVVRGPDGAYYVGELTGFPYPVGGARVYRVVPGKAPQVVATGLTNVIDLALDGKGRLYALEIAHNGLLSGNPAGALLRVRPGGTHEVVDTGPLTTPGGLAIRGGNAYVSNCGTCAGQGTVVRAPLR